MISPNYTLYDNSLGIALVLMLFFAFYFLLAKTPDKRIFSNYLMSRRLMGGAVLALSANYSVHLFVAPRFLWKEAAIMMNLSSYYLTYWLFNCAFMVLLKPHYFTVRRFLMHIAGWLAYVLLSIVLLLGVSKGTMQHAAIALMALWLIAYGICLSRNIILTYRRAVRLFDDMHSEDIGAYIHWMSIFVHFERLIASASSPPGAPPTRTLIPTPTPTKIAPTNAASSGISAICGYIGGNSSQMA